MQKRLSSSEERGVRGGERHGHGFPGLRLPWRQQLRLAYGSTASTGGVLPVVPARLIGTG